MPPFGSSKASSPPNYGGRGTRGSGRIPRSDLLIIGCDAPRASRRSGRTQKPTAAVVALVVHKLKTSLVSGEVEVEAKKTTDIFTLDIITNYIYTYLYVCSVTIFCIIKPHGLCQRVALQETYKLTVSGLPLLLQQP